MAFVIGITGGFGQGKTLTAVIKSQQWSMASGCKLFANFPMRGAYLFDRYTDWYSIADVHGSIIVFDEAQSNFDGRKFAQEENVTLTQIFNFVRKLNCLFIFVLPSYSNIDSRIRQRTDILINCTKSPNDTITNWVYDYPERMYGEFGKLINRWVLPVSSQKKVHELKLYDTNSMVHRFPMPSGKKNTEDFFIELDRRHDLALKRLGKKVNIRTLAKEGLGIYEPSNTG